MEKYEQAVKAFPLWFCKFKSIMVPNQKMSTTLQYNGSVEERITKTLDKMSPKHKRIARFMLDNRYFISFSPASEVGDKNGVSAATVVRFAQFLGYEGYSELQHSMRSELPTYLTATERMQARLSSQNPPISTPQQVFYTDIKNIERTAGNLSDKSLQDTLDAVQKARHILIVGAGISTAPVVFLTHSLKVMGFDATSVQGEWLQAAVELACKGEEDLLIAIDLWRYVRMTVNAVSQAKDQGIPVIAITDSIVSPLTQKADIVLGTITQGIAHSHSIVAMFSLINVIIAMLADRIPEQVYGSLQVIDASYRGNDLLVMR